MSAKEPRVIKCPRCGGPIRRVENPGHLNDDQFDAVKAGDYYCEACPGNDRGKRNLCYWWYHELAQPEDFQ